MDAMTIRHTTRHAAFGAGALLLLLVCGSRPWAQEIPARAGTVEENPWRRHVIDDSSKGADGTRLADVNGDGLLDIASPWEEGGAVRVYVQPGAEQVRKPWKGVTVGKVRSPEDAVLCDLDGDGALDVISSTEGEGRAVFVHWAPREPGSFLDAAAWQTAELPASKGRKWMFVAPGQIDGENGPDLVAGGKNEDAWIGLFRAPADARDIAGWKWQPLCRVGWVMSILQMDMDADGDPDILYSDRRGEDRGVWWLENPGRDEVCGEWNRRAIGGQNREVMFLDVGHLGASDDLDVAVATLEGSVLLFTKSPGADAWRTREIAIPVNTGEGKSVAIGDVDADGRNDLVVSTAEGKGKHCVFWLANDGAESWKATDISGLPGTKFDMVKPLDVDADGDLDVITCEERENLGVFWYENPRLNAEKEEEEPPVSPLVGQELIPDDVDWEHPVYETAFDDPAVLADWVLEGGKAAGVENGRLVLESEPPIKGAEGDQDHLVCWLKKTMPADFLLEFSIRPQSRKQGLAIVFFNARGIHGENIFEPPIKPRDGIFKQYHSSDLNNYHISYWAGARGTAHVRKNKGFNLVAKGRDLVVDGPEGAFQTIRVYKRGGAIRLMVDNIVSVAWDDDGVKYGPILANDGWIGLRQMARTIRCEYDALKVYPLLSRP